MRPIATSDSCSTLVDLNDDHKVTIESVHLPLNAQISQLDNVYQTHLLLPSDIDEYDSLDDEDDEYRAFVSQPQKQRKESAHQYLCLPSESASETRIPIDHHLRTIPAVVDSANMLLSSPPRELSLSTRGSTSRILNICQGEIGHASSSQCDIIVSDKSTTCHIVAVRSTIGGSSTPLASLAHIDKEGHESCLRDMIQVHRTFHAEKEEEKKEADDGCQMIDMDLHIMGGFDDEDESSRAISESLINTFSLIAQDESATIRMTLQTCAVSSMNDNGLFYPIGRGLGMDLKSGDVFLASVDESVAGPATTLRSVRLWSGEKEKLSVVHTTKSNSITVSAFPYETIQGTDVILSLPDHIILQHTSTSPEVEHDGFCDDVRRTLSFMKDNKCTDIFGMNCDKPVVYTRSNGNNWVEDNSSL